jgi:hypothetical protein
MDMSVKATYDSVQEMCLQVRLNLIPDYQLQSCHKKLKKGHDWNTVQEINFNGKQPL